MTATAVAAALTATAEAEPTITPTPTPTPTPTLTPTPTPSPPDQLISTQRAYRWVHIEWDAESVFTRFIIRFRDNHGWVRLFETPTVGPRVIINHAARTAEVRGLHYQSGPIRLTVTGVTARNQSVESEIYSVRRGARPNVSGHQHDHTVAYRWGSGVVSSTVATTLKAVVATAASAWTTRPFVKVCKDPCASNSGRVIPVQLYENRNGCRSGVACLSSAGRKTIETHVSDRDRRLKVEFPPIVDGQITWVWTRTASLNKGEVDSNDPYTLYLHLDAVVIHELGHALGLKDISDTNSVMDTGIHQTSIQPVDDNRLYKLYESHTAGEGW